MTCFFTRWLTRFSIFYLIYAALWRCSSTPFSFTYPADHELLVCREMSSFQEHVSPALHEAAGYVHGKLDPYVGTYLRGAHRAWAQVQPVFHDSAKRAHSLYWSHVEPAARELGKQAHRWSEPHRRTAHKHYKKHLRPHVKKAHQAVHPYIRTYYKDVHPHVLNSLTSAQKAHASSSKYYVDHVHPRLKDYLYQVYSYVRHKLYPLVHANYVKHAHPHVSKMHGRASAAVNDAVSAVKDSSIADSVSQVVHDTVEKVEKAVSN